MVAATAGSMSAASVPYSEAAPVSATCMMWLMPSSVVTCQSGLADAESAWRMGPALVPGATWVSSSK